MQKQHSAQNKGFVIFIAVVVTSILVLISLLVSNISLRQLTFSFAGKNSQIAFVTANSGIECALYWDLNNQPVGSETAFATSSTQTFTCNGQSFTAGNGGRTMTAATTTFTLDFSTGGNTDFPYCTDVIVAKWFDGTNLNTTIESRGHNPCTAGSKQVERAIRVKYP
jgi:Tfp pilus assembly protein PilX